LSAPLEANLRALAVRQPGLARAVGTAVSDPDIGFVASSSGLPVPVLRDGRALHSKVDPVKEARRLAATLPATGVAVFLGLGGGYQPAALLATGSLFAGVIVERDPSALRALLGGRDLSGLLGDPRISVVADPVDTAAAVTAAVLAAWAPGLMGDLRTVPLRPWCEAAREVFDRAACGVEAARGLAAADWAAQARFGRRWFVNALCNLPAIERARLEVAPIRRAIVTGAGPSLDRAAAGIARERHGCLLAATDTSLPALLARGLVPDLAVSIDCQAWGYHHVLPGLPAGLPLLLDVSSPPVLARAARDIGFFASGHPFARWLSRHWRSLPVIDTAGGNVTHAAVSAAHALGARELRLAGVDFSYPLGSPYARGTWLHQYHRVRESRCVPCEGALYRMLVAAPGTVRERTPDGPRYTPPLMRSYRLAFERLAGSLDAEVDDAWCLGPPMPVTPRADPTPPRWNDGFRMGAGHDGWRQVLESYGTLLRGLPSPTLPLAAWWNGLAPDAREGWQTLLPLLPGLVVDHTGSGADTLVRARAWTLGRVSALAAVQDGGVAHE
jgi:hypothetical protein